LRCKRVFCTSITMGRKPTFKKEKKLPQAQSAEEIEARDRQEEAKQRSRAGRRADCDDKPKKKKAAQDSDSEDSDDDSDFGFDQVSEEEEEEEEIEEERVAKPKSLMDQLGVQLEGAANLNVAAKDEKKAVKMKDMKMSDMGAAKPELSRREREALEAAKKEAAYRKKHEAGETDEAKSDLARLAEVRKRREDAKKAKEAQAESAKAEESKKKAEESKKQTAEVVLTMPTQKEVKSALLKMKDACNPDFQKKHKLDSLSGNKLAKMKYSDFTKIWNDFVESCSEKEHREFAA